MEARVAGVAATDANGIRRNVHCDPIPRTRWAIQPEGALCTRECPESAKNLHNQQGIEFSIGCKDYSSGPMIVFRGMNPSGRTQHDIVGKDIEYDLLTYIEIIRLTCQWRRDEIDETAVQCMDAIGQAGRMTTGNDGSDQSVLHENIWRPYILDVRSCLDCARHQGHGDLLAEMFLNAEPV